MAERYGARKYKIDVSYQKVLSRSKRNEDGEWVCVHLIRVGFRKVRYICGEKLHCLCLKKKKETFYIVGYLKVKL